MKLAIFVCAFNEDQELISTVNELVGELHELVKEKIIDDWSLLLIDDGSTDNTWRVILTLCQQTNIRGIRFSRSFGYHAAISCGLEFSEGDWIVNITADGEEPPKYLRTLILKSQEGYDIVWAIRSRRVGNYSTRLSSYLSHLILRSFTTTYNYPPHNIGGGYFLITKKAQDVFRTIEDRHRSVISLLNWIGFRQGFILYIQRPTKRPTRWGLVKKINYFLDVFYADSAIPTKFSLYLALFISLLMIPLLVITFFHDNLYLPSIIILLCLIIIEIGLLAPYVWMNLQESRKRPLYIIAEETERS